MIETCEECKATGQVGSEIAPYNFGRNKAGKVVTRWLCTPFTSRPCRDIRYAKYREWLRANESP